MTYSKTAQLDIAAFVSQRGYLDGYTPSQIIARQLVKQLEETCEALQAIKADDVDLHLFIQQARSMGNWAREVFDAPSSFDDVVIDRRTVLEELPDMVVPLAVLAQTVGVPDMLDLALAKAMSDVKRGVRNGATA